MNLKKLRIHYLLRLAIFWLLFFALFRLLFIIYHHAKIPDGQHSETSLSFIYALRLDIATLCWLSFVPYIIWSFQQFYKKRALHLLNRIYIIISISIISILSIANIKIYGDWGTQLSARALNYLLYPKEVMTFISGWAMFILLLFCSGCIYVALKLYKKYVTNFSYPIENRTIKIVQIVIIPVLLIFGLRGGIQQIPINESSSYYSSFQINNHIATNNMWYLVHTIMDANDTRNPYEFMNVDAAKKIRNGLFMSSANKKNILKTKQPNIVMIVLESWTADIIKALGGDSTVTPHFNELQKDGLLFTQMYSSGFRTEQGIVSILSGFPAQPSNSIITTPSKAEQLPSLNVDLNKQGYSSSFYYGGEVEFANMKSYLLNTRFKKIVDKNNFDESEWNSKWGAHDEFVLTKQLSELKDQKEPFFSIVLTLSTHEPYEVPMTSPFNGASEEEHFKNAAYYTDVCLFNYFKEAKKQPWYNNTVFILVADHGHHLPKNRDMDFPEGHRITAFITGGALADSLRGKTMDKICNQNDLSAIILSQLNLPYAEFMWSKDIFNEQVQEFAYYSNENSLGWITPQQNIVYSFVSKKVIGLQPKIQKKLNDSILMQSKAYLQTLYQQYLDY
jgi:phosphoglycerol transferase MdoB-like AlkP superfamily enzyme